MSRKKILLLANAVSLAHPTRMWKLACDVESLGYDVHFATSKDFFRFLLPQRKNIKVHHISSVSTKVFNDRHYRGQYMFSMEDMIRDVQEDEELISTTKPDIILADVRPTSIIPAKIRGIPYLGLSQYHWSRGFEKKRLIPPIKPVITFGRNISAVLEPLITPLILKIILAKVNKFFCNHPLAKPANLEPFETLSDLYLAGDHTLFADLEDIYPESVLSKEQHFIGPIIWSNTELPWPENWPRDFGSKPVAYVTMGSTGHLDTIPSVLEALREAGYQILLSTYGYDVSSVDLRETWVAPFVPGEEALKVADLIVCNGGTGTTYHALSHGVPIIAITQNMDQVLHSDQLEKIGVARMIYADQVSSSRVAKEIDRLVHSQKTESVISTIKEQISLSDQKSILNDVLSRI